MGRKNIYCMSALRFLKMLASVLSTAGMAATVGINERDTHERVGGI